VTATAVRHARHRQRRPLWPAVTGACVALVAVIAGAIAWLGGPSEAHPPYTDPAATGRLALCDRAGHQLASGSTTSAPFVVRAVGSTAAAARYAGPGRVATLYAFQPRTGVPADEWSGRMLTAASRYTNPDHPMAEATAEDTDLQDFLAAYPADDAGYVQLRLYLGAPGQPTDTQTYDSLDLHVSGTSWRAVGGATIPCSSGSAESIETILGTAP
jgi:hypothetical protein